MAELQSVSFSTREEVDFVECQGIQKFDDTLINQTNILGFTHRNMRFIIT